MQERVSADRHTGWLYGMAVDGERSVGAKLFEVVVVELSFLSPFVGEGSNFETHMLAT